jgi:hypothetical protein
MSRPPIRPGLLVAALLLAAVAAIVFLLPGNLLLGGSDTDLITQFLAFRDFAARSVLAGHLPLWNPYTYSGEQFFGDFQSALLYPPNVIFLFLPLVRAANLSLLMHLVIMGWGTHRLACRRGLHPLAAGLGAAVLPLSGAVFPHLYAGHLSNLCAMAWTPWIFAGLEDFYRNRRFQGLLLTSGAICLQILAGHPQTFLYAAVAAGLYALICSITEPSLRRRALPAIAAVYAAAAALSAAQLFPGMAGSAESIRNGKLLFSFVSLFSFPPENLLTFVAPGFFGDLTRHPYWGRSNPWEMGVFVGVSGLVLAGTALLDPVRRRTARVDLGMAALLLLFALGGNTPIFRVLYDYAPGIDRFRGASKFAFPAVMFLVMAVGGGADALIRGRVPRRTLLLAGFLAAIQRTNGSFLPAELFTDRGFIDAAGAQAGWSLIQAGAILVLTGAGLLAARRRPLLRWAPLLLLPLEMIGFARTQFATADVGYVIPRELQQFVAAHPGDYRVLNLLRPNNGFFLGAPDIGGIDPGPLFRYVEFITYTQGGNPDEVALHIAFRNSPAVYAMLRLRYTFSLSDGNLQVTEQAEKPMAHVQLISDYRVMRGRNAIFSALTSPSFDPSQTVLLESAPYPRPVPGANPGTVRILGATADTLTLEADVASPTLLLITDPYSSNWHARPLGDSAQSRYDVLPANYILRAIPLASGHHRILVEYVPRGFHLGIAVSIVAWLLWLIFALRLRKSPR